MTQKEKIRELKSTIQFLYEKEGRSKSYISRLLSVDRKTLSYQIEDWGFVQAQVHRMTPSNQKFANKNKQLIKSRYDNDVPDTEIAKELGVKANYLAYIVERVDVLREAKEAAAKRREQKAQENRDAKMEKSSYDYNIVDEEGEIWKEILGYDGYFISNMGRVKRYSSRYKSFYLLTPHYNEYVGRMYVVVKNKTLQIARLVAFAFVEGHSEERNTVDHKDNNPLNNRWDNLAWVSQAENNRLAYERGRQVNRGYQKRGKFKKIILDNKYEFKTITALAKFLGVSTTQVNRYLNGETKTDHEFKFIY